MEDAKKPDGRSKNGGSRANAGRKVSESGRRKSRDVSLDDDTVAILKEYGDGNLSEGIRRAAALVDIADLIA